MNELKIIGHKKIGRIEFTGIEGGFGEDKKAMLVKDIAKIHNSTIKRINELINRNIKRFKDGIDLIDLKQVVRNDLFSDYGFTKAQWGNANHVYLLSERGYAKLLKILDDDKAWEIYDILVDNYFNMRVAIKEKKPQIVDNSKLEIMAKNASTRRANLLYKLAMATKSQHSKEHLLSKAAEELTGERFIPVMKEKTYTATEIAQELGTSPQKVGKIANKLGLKAEKPAQNKYGKWVEGKSPYSDKQVDQWLYFEKGKKAIAKEYGK